MICDWVPLPFNELRQYCAIGEVRGVTFHSERSIVDGDPQDRVTGEGLFEGFKGFLLGLRPFPGYLLGQVCERSRYRTEPLNESSVEIAKPNETLNIPLILWYRPLSHR